MKSFWIKYWIVKLQHLPWTPELVFFLFPERKLNQKGMILWACHFKNIRAQNHTYKRQVLGVYFFLNL